MRQLLGRFAAVLLAALSLSCGGSSPTSSDSEEDPPEADPGWVRFHDSGVLTVVDAMAMDEKWGEVSYEHEPENAEDWTSFSNDLSASATGPVGSASASETSSYSLTGGGAPDSPVTIVWNGTAQMNIAGYAWARARTSPWIVVEVVDGPVAYSFQATVSGSGTGVAITTAWVHFVRVEGRRPYAPIEEITPEVKLGENPQHQQNGVLQPGYYYLVGDVTVTHSQCTEPCTASGDASLSATLTVGEAP